MSSTISENDIQALVVAMNSGQREAIGEQIGRLLQRSNLSPQDMKLALQMIDRMIADSAEKVRVSLSTHIAESPNLTRPMIDRLLADVASVSLPIVQLSPLLSDDDLMAQMQRGPAFQEAAAARSSVSSSIADHIVRHGSERAVGIVIRNPGAAMDDTSLDLALDRFNDSVEVLGATAARPRLPLSVAERLVSITVAEECIRAVSDVMMKALMDRHDLPAVLAEDLAMHSRDRAIADMARGRTGWEEVETLTARMHKLGRLSSSLMLRVLASGDQKFFACGMANLSGWTRERVEAAMNAAGTDSFRRMYDAAGLEPLLFHAFRVARDEIRSGMSGSDDIGNPQFVDRVVDRISDEYRSISPAGLEQVLNRLRQKTESITGEVADVRGADA